MRPVLLVALVGAALIAVLVLVLVAQQTLTSDQLERDESVVNNNNRTKSTTWFSSLLGPVVRLFGAEAQGDDNSNTYNGGSDNSGRLIAAKYYRVPQGYLNFRRAIVQTESETVGSKPEALVVPVEERAQSIGDLSGSNSISNSQLATNGQLTLGDQQQATGLSANRCRGMGGRCSFGGGSEAIMPPMAIGNDARNVKCHNNKYDRIIAQKMALNDISRPIIDANGRFDNPFPTWKHPSVLDLAKFLALESDDSNVPRDKAELDRELPVLKPDFKINEAQSENFRVTWVGHATLLIQVDGLNILTDPIFSERASFTQYVGPKRFREPACEVKHLPPINIVLISHNHYDHLDSNSVKQLNDRFGNDCRWIVPLGLGSYLQSMSIENYVELDWWRKDCYHVPPPGLNSSNRLLNNSTNTTTTSNISPQIRSMVSSRSSSPTLSHSDTTSPYSLQHNRATRATNRMELDVYLTPTQHWTRRGVNDINKSLWGSYVIVSRDGSTFFFGGDTAYCSAFKEIGKVFGPFSGAAIPIGAYKPRWFLKYSHVDPQEAVQIHRDLRSMKSIAIHHATFVLSSEHYKEPSRLLNEIMADLRVKEEVKEPFIALKHGETMEFCRHC